MYVNFAPHPSEDLGHLFKETPCVNRSTSVRQRRLAVGTHLFREGDAAKYFYKIKSGVLRSTRVLKNGRRQVLSFSLPGDIIGFPDDEHHNTDCDVIAPAEVTLFRRKALANGEESPEMRQLLLLAALREISAMQDHLMVLARKSAIEKVASFLAVLSKRTGTSLGNYSTFELPMSRADIADFLGLTIETVSRTFSVLRKSGAIALETSKIVVVLDMDALLDMSQTSD
jgi:CRP-like cAMP-binding protein